MATTSKVMIETLSQRGRARRVRCGEEECRDMPLRRLQATSGSGKIGDRVRWFARQGEICNLGAESNGQEVTTVAVLPHEGTYSIMYGPFGVPVGAGYRPGYLARRVNSAHSLWELGAQAREGLALLRRNL